LKVIDWTAIGRKPHGGVLFELGVLTIQRLMSRYMGNRSAFIDEAGTSGASHEQIAVVAAFVLPRSLLEDAMKLVTMVADERVPAQLRKGFTRAPCLPRSF
jgi:hypothetical protein